MLFAVLKPKERKIGWIESDLETAQLSIGLVDVDHGTLIRRHVGSPPWRSLEDGDGIGYVVYEYGFFLPPYETAYVSIQNRLMAGNVLLYRFDVAGDTVPMLPDLITESDIKWLPTRADVELAIACKLVTRPQISVNGEVLWQWPQPQEVMTCQTRQWPVSDAI